MTALLYFLLVLELVVLAHLLGHVLAAWLLRVSVELHVGFGPALPGCRRRWGCVTAVVAVFPLGGYVTAARSDTDPAPVWRRLGVVLGGLVGSLLLAWAGFAAWRWCGVERLAAVVGSVEPGSPAWRKGVSGGAEIVQVGDVRQPVFEDVLTAVRTTGPDRPLTLVYLPPEQTAPVTIAVTPTQGPDDIRPRIGILPARCLRLLSQDQAASLEGPVLPHSAAARAQPPLQFEETIVGTNDPDHKGQLTDLPLDPRNPAGGLRDAFAFTERLLRLAGHDITVQVRRRDGGLEQVRLPPAFHRTFAARLAMGPVVALREGSPAERAGLRAADPDDLSLPAGDRILGVEVRNPETGAPIQFAGATLDPLRLPFELRQWAKRAWRNGPPADREDRIVRVEVLRESAPDDKALGQPQRVVLWLEWDWDRRFESDASPDLAAPLAIPELGIAYQVEARVASAAGAGDEDLQEGDEITALLIPAPGDAGRPEWLPLDRGRFAGAFAFLQDRIPGGAVTFQVQRRGQLRPITVPLHEERRWPRANRGLLLDYDRRWQRAEGVLDAAGLGLEDMGRAAAFTGTSVGAMIARPFTPRPLGGPLALSSTASRPPALDAALLVRLALLSLGFALLNLLPIPLLDGGDVLLLGFEKVRGKPLSQRGRLLVNALGLGLLVLVLLLPAWLALI